MCAVGVAEFDGGKRFLRVDFDDGDIGVLIDSDYRGNTAWVAVAVGIAGEPDVDFVGFIDDVVVGDDVAAGIDDETGAESTAFSAGAIAVVTTLAAEEAVEEVLHVAGGLLAVVAIGVVWLGKPLAAASAFVGGRLGQLLCIDVNDGGTDLFYDLRKAVGEGHWGWNDERAGVRGIDAGLLFAADVACEDRAGQNACRECRKESKRRGEAAAAYAL